MNVAVYGGWAHEKLWCGLSGAFRISIKWKQTPWTGEWARNSRSSWLSISHTMIEFIWTLCDIHMQHDTEWCQSNHMLNKHNFKLFSEIYYIPVPSARKLMSCNCSDGSIATNDSAKQLESTKFWKLSSEQMRFESGGGDMVMGKY